eukprot:403355843
MLRKRILREKQRVKDDIEKMKYKLYQQSLKLINFEPQNPKYYENFPVKPGIYFYKALVTSHIPISCLKILIPHTVGLFDERFHLYTHPTKGNLIYKSNFRDQDFIEACESMIRHEANKRIDSPFIIRKSIDFPDYAVEKIAIGFQDEKIDELLTKMEGDVILQQYIHPFGGKATFIRFQYHNPRSISGKANSAVLVTNRQRIMENSQYKPLQERAFINYGIINSFDAFQQKQQAGFQNLEDVAQQLVEFVLCSHKLKISKIVLDFVKDDYQEKIWFTGVKYFEVDEKSSLYRQLQSKNDNEQNLVPSKKQDPQEAQLISQCILCRDHYEKSHIKRVITYKMILDLKNHLNKRGIFLLEKINPQILNDLNINHARWKTNSCKICDICYLIVVAEQDLQNVEKQFAEAQNIPTLKTDSKLEEQLMAEQNAIANKGKPKYNTSDFKEKLLQWRILITLNSFFDLEKEDIDRFVKDDDKFYLQLKIFDYVTLFKIKTDKFKKVQSFDPEVIDSSQTILITALDLFKVRVHYFFTRGEDITQFLQNTEIEVRLTIGDCWHKHILATGFINPFKHLNKFTYQRVQMQSFRVFLFSEHFKKFSIDGVVGIKQDKPIKTENVQLYLQNDIYVPDNGYYNCDPLPIEWLEIIDRKVMLQKYQQFEENEKECKKSLKQQIFDNYFNLAHTDERKIQRVNTLTINERQISSARTKISSNNQPSYKVESQYAKKQVEISKLSTDYEKVYELMLKSQQTAVYQTRPHSSYLTQNKKNHQVNQLFNLEKQQNSQNHEKLLIQTSQNDYDSYILSQARDLSTDLNDLLNDKLNSQRGTLKTDTNQSTLLGVQTQSSKFIQKQRSSRNQNNLFNMPTNFMTTDKSSQNIIRSRQNQIDPYSNYGTQQSLTNHQSSTQAQTRLQSARNQYFTTRNKSSRDNSTSSTGRTQTVSSYIFSNDQQKSLIQTGQKSKSLKKLLNQLTNQGQTEQISQVPQFYNNHQIQQPMKSLRKSKSQSKIMKKSETKYEQYSEYKQDLNQMIKQVLNSHKHSKIDLKLLVDQSTSRKSKQKNKKNSKVRRIIKIPREDEGSNNQENNIDSKKQSQKCLIQSIPQN